MEQPLALFEDKVMLVEIYKSYIGGRSLYDATRYAWRAKLSRVKEVDYVLAVKEGLIISVFVPTEWLPATPDNFPRFPNTPSGRIGFRGYEAAPEVQDRYCGKRAPAKQHGDQSEFHYFGGA
ncbi:MAG: hypothetical protein ACREE2_02640 [Stellaceae bacterium]